MNIAAHKNLYESSIAFGLRETLLAEQGNADTEKRVKSLHFLITLIESNKCNLLHLSSVKSYSAIYPPGSTVYPEELGRARNNSWAYNQLIW